MCHGWTGGEGCRHSLLNLSRQVQTKVFVRGAQRLRSLARRHMFSPLNFLEMISEISQSRSRADQIKFAHFYRQALLGTFLPPLDAHKWCAHHAPAQLPCLPRGSRRQAVQRLFDMCWRHFLTEIGAPEHSDTLVLYPGFWTPPNPLAPWSCTVESSKQDGSSLCDGEKEI